MSALLAVVAQVLHAALMLAAAPLLMGGMDRLRARLLGRVGPPWPQPWRSLLRLTRKQPVVAENASWLFTAAPTAALAATWLAAALVPSFATGMEGAPLADLIVIAGLLALARCCLALAAMDVGTAFGGLGTQRTLPVATFADPALLLVAFTLALVVGTTNLDAVSRFLITNPPGSRVSLGMAGIALAIVAIAENERLPFGNASSHLELEMMQNAVALEYSGRHLAMIEFGAALRMLLWLSLIVAAFVPFGAAQADAPLLWLPGLVAWAAKIAGLGAALTVLEAGVARVRIPRVPELVGVAVLLGVLAAIFLFISQGFA